MMLPTISQNIFRQDKRVIVGITEDGDTVLQFHLADAKIILAELMSKANADSLLNVYMLRDSLSTSIITLNMKEIEKLNTKCDNKDIQIKNLETINTNNDSIIAFKENIIEKQKKEIRKQKTLKTLALIGNIALPILILILAR